MKREPFSGHIWVRVAGHEVELHDASKHYVDICGIYLRDSAGTLHIAYDHVALSFDNIVYQSFRSQIVPNRFHSLKAAVNFIRFAVNESVGYKRI